MEKEEEVDRNRDGLKLYKVRYKNVLCFEEDANKDRSK